MWEGVGHDGVSQFLVVYSVINLAYDEMIVLVFLCLSCQRYYFLRLFWNFFFEVLEYPKRLIATNFSQALKFFLQAWRYVHEALVFLVRAVR